MSMCGTLRAFLSEPLRTQKVYFVCVCVCQCAYKYNTITIVCAFVSVYSIVCVCVCVGCIACVSGEVIKRGVAFVFAAWSKWFSVG